MASPIDRLATSAARLPGSGIREIMDLVVGMEGALRLEIGEPDFTTPQHIVDAAMAAANRGVGYTQTAGLSQLREAITQKLRRVNGLEYGADQVLVTQGAVGGIAATFAAFLEPGDQVLIPDPGWPNYEMLAILNAASPVRYRLLPSAAFRPDIDEIGAMLTPRTKILVLNSPSNPTGVVLTAREIESIVSLAAANGTVVLSDEVYDELVFDGKVTPSAGFAPEWVVGAYSFSKTYAMTGWRVGYIAASRDVIAALTRVQEPLISCVSEVSQLAAIAALGGPHDCVDHMRDAYRNRRDLVIDALGGAGIETTVPNGAFYLMLPLGPGVDSRAAALELAREGIGVAPGSAFGPTANDHLRISLASSEEVLREAIERIVRWMGR